MAEDLFYFNGVDGSTGSYLMPPATPAVVARCAQGFRPDPRELDELRYRHELATEKVFGPGEGRDPCDLAQVGWGVVFPHDCDPAVRAALRPLLDHRRSQATAAGPDYYREFWGEDAYRPGESKSQFLARHGAAPGPVDPQYVPYYLLLVGSGREIPFTVQYQLDVQYAVGRLFFDTADEYGRYAHSVVEAETSGVRRTRSLSFFAPQNPGDRATELSRQDLVEPLVRRLSGEHEDWRVEAAVADDATKQGLLTLMAGSSPPALLFTAGHGVGWPAGHPAQLRRQGALVCQEWPGPEADTEFSRDAYLCAEDVPDDARVHGLVAFHFACFGAGTPEWDEFAHREGGSAPTRLAVDPFVSALPRRLLAHPNGGALAIAGHVDRAWGYSFRWPRVGRQTEVYRSCLARLLRGHPIGSAFDYVNQRYAELSSDLSSALHDVQMGRRPDQVALSTMWTANNDARGFIVVGDPAVRVPSLLPADRPGSPDGPVRVRAGDDSSAHPGIGARPVEEADGDPGMTTVEGATGSDPGDVVRDLQRRLGAAAEDVTAALERLTGARPVLEVAIYSSDDPSRPREESAGGGYAGARLRMLARVGPAGRVEVLVPERDGEVDPSAWPLAMDAMKLAREERSELIRYLGTSVTALLSAMKDVREG